MNLGSQTAPILRRETLSLVSTQVSESLEGILLAGLPRQALCLPDAVGAHGCGWLRRQEGNCVLAPAITSSP